MNSYIFIDRMTSLHCQHLKSDIDQYLRSTSTQKTTGSTQKITRKTNGSTQKRILEEIRLHPFTTRTKLAEVIGITPDGVKKQLDKLKRAGIIKHCGSDKGGHWEIISTETT